MWKCRAKLEDLTKVPMEVEMEEIVADTEEVAKINFVLLAIDQLAKEETKRHNL